MGGVIPTEDEARRINAAVRAYEASATSRLTSRGHVPKKRVRIEPTVASPGSTTNTLGNCPCTSAPGIITPTVTAKFSHRQAYRWKRQGLMSMLNDIDGFNVTSEPVAVWNTDTPTNSYISADITRTVGADSDVYVLTVTEDSTHGWKLNFSIKSGASPNIADEIDWTEVCVSPNAPSPSKSNAVIVLDTETMTSDDGAYVNHPGCAGCLVPAYTKNTFICSDISSAAYQLELPYTIAVGSPVIESPAYTSTGVALDHPTLGDLRYNGSVLELGTLGDCSYESCGDSDPSYVECYYCDETATSGVSIGAAIVKSGSNVILAASLGQGITGRGAYTYITNGTSAPTTGNWQAFGTTVTLAQYTAMLDFGAATIPYDSHYGDGGRCDDAILDSLTLYFM